jgi:hypothetical protein
MPDPRELRAIREEVQSTLKILTESALVSAFAYSEEVPKNFGQFWEYELNIGGDDNYLQFKCGCFFGTGTNANSNLDINLFYSNNDRLFEEFENAVAFGSFDALLSLLKRADQLTVDQEVRASITVSSYANAADKWTRGVCDEIVLILHVDEEVGKSLEIGCMQSERYRINVPVPSGATYLRVPYDKVDRFAGAQRVESHSPETYHEYQVALSFAGEDRAYVSQVANRLREMRLRLFYDDYENVDLWGKDLYVHLDEVYRKRARYCVVFLSKHYSRKLWTNHERESAQARAFEEHSEYILPVRLDDTEVPGIRPTTGYLKRLPPKKLAEAIRRKVFEVRAT